MKISILLQILLLLFLFNSDLNSENLSPDGDSTSSVFLPESLISLGSGGSFALVVNKSDSRVDIYQQKNNLSIEKVKSYRASTGQIEGNKFVEGDLKTPEGIYYLVRIREDAELMNKYGIRAFDLNYPNQFDRLESKTGYGIWLHGTDEPERLNNPRTSEGCVVVSNEDLQEISDYITLYRTPIVISENHSFVSAEKLNDLKGTVYNFVLKWLDAWAHQNIDRYSECYSESFKGTKRKRAAWLNRKKSIFKNTKWANIDIADLKILRDGSRYTISFYQRYRSNLMDDTGIKWVYLENRENELKILSEEWHPVSKAVSGHHWNNGSISMSHLVEDIPVIDLDADGRPVIVKPNVSFPFSMAEEVQQEPGVEEITAEVVEEAAEEVVAPEPKIKPPVHKRIAGKPLVAVRNVTVTRELSDRVDVSFEVINLTDNGAKKRGWIYLVASWSSTEEHTAFPDKHAIQGVPTEPKKGDWYSVRWYKQDKGSFRRPAAAARLQEIKCYIFDQSGRLVSDEIVSANSRGER